MTRNPLTHLRHDSGRDFVGLDLPPGRAVHETAAGLLEEPILWISDTRPDASLWRSLQDCHARTGLWPLLLEESRYEAGRPWTTGELDPGLIKSRPGDHDVDTLLAGWWSAYTDVSEDDDMLSAPERTAITAPFGQRWPGIAPAGTLQEDPAARAADFAEHLVAAAWLTAPRLGLSASARGADALADLGWGGPLNYENDTAQFSTVLRSWEERFAHESSASDQPCSTSASRLRPLIRTRRCASLPNTSRSAPTTCGSPARTPSPVMPRASSIDPGGRSGGTEPRHRRRAEGARQPDAIATGCPRVRRVVQPSGERPTPALSWRRGPIRRRACRRRGRRSRTATTGQRRHRRRRDRESRRRR